MKGLPAKVDLRSSSITVYDQGELGSSAACAMAVAVELMSKRGMKMTKNVKWVRVTEDDQYGAITTLVGKKEFVMPKSKKLLVKFPDGTEQELPVVMRYHVEHGSEMGRDYSVPNQLPHVVIDYHGFKIEVRLGESKLKVVAVE